MSVICRYLPQRYCRGQFEDRPDLFHSDFSEGTWRVVRQNKVQGGIGNKVGKTKRLLVGVLIIGALSALIGAGTFATFDATTTNSATFTSGTIVLSNTVNGGAGCAFDAAHTPGDFGANHQLAGAYNLGAMNAATTRYFVVSVSFPLSSDNAYQGSKAGLVFTWNLAQ